MASHRPVFVRGNVDSREVEADGLTGPIDPEP